MDHVGLAILGVGNEADQAVLSRAEVCHERGASSFVQRHNPTYWFGRRRAFHSACIPGSEVGNRLPRSQLQQGQLVGLGPVVLDQDRLPARSEGPRYLKVVFDQLDGGVRRGEVGDRRGGGGSA